MSEFEQNVIGVWGEEGELWLKSLPSLAENIIPLKNLSYNYVSQGIRTADKLQVFFKLGCDVVNFCF